MFPFKKYRRSQTSPCFNVRAITEKRIVRKKFPVNGINLKIDSCEYFPTESSAGGMFLYMGNHLSCKPRHGLRIYKSAEL